jgi:hypothetical protein
VSNLFLTVLTTQGIKRKQHEMDVEKGRTLATAFLSMEMYKQQRQKVAVETEVIVNAAVNAAIH